MILASSSASRLQPVLPEYWTRHTIAVAFSVKLSDIRKESTVVIVGHYAQPPHQEALSEELSFFVEYLHRKGHRNVVVAGDFNRPVTEMNALANRLQLTLAQDNFHPTHKNKPSDSQAMSQTDFILCSNFWHSTKALLEHQTGSDHYPLLTQVTFHASAPNARPAAPIVTVLKKTATKV